MLEKPGWCLRSRKGDRDRGGEGRREACGGDRLQN